MAAASAPNASADTAFTDEGKLHLEVLKGSFLEALGDDAVYEIQQKNPKGKIYTKDIAWIKQKWEDCYKHTKNVAESLVKLWNGVRPKEKPILQHWIEVGEKVAHCKLDQMTVQDIEDHIQSTVNDPKQAKTYWKKKINTATLAEYIRSTTEADREMRRVQPQPIKADKDKSETDHKEKVKDEPVSKVDRKKSKQRATRRRLQSPTHRKPKDSHCYRCGEPNWTPEHGKNCKARKATCKSCQKKGHFAKMGKTKKQDKKEKVRRVDNSDTESSNTEISTLETEEASQTDSSEDASVHRFQEVSTRDTTKAETLSIKAIRKQSERRTGHLKRTGDELELLIKINGHKVAAILDTGSPITILPKKYKPEIKPTRILRATTNRRFVDVSGRPLHINNRYKIETELNGTKQEVIWWEINTDTKPIIGMDSFDKLGLRLIQRKTKTSPKDICAVQNHIKSERRSDQQPKRRPTKPDLAPTVPDKADLLNLHKTNDEDHRQAQLQQKIAGQFPKLFKTNTSVNNFQYKV